MQVADALSQETAVKGGEHNESAIGSLLIFLFIKIPPSVINVTTLLFGDDVKMALLRSQSDICRAPSIMSGIGP